MTTTAGLIQRGKDVAGGFIQFTSDPCLHFRTLISELTMALEKVQPVSVTAAHSIVWTLNRDYVTAEVICEDDDCLNWYVCREYCEVVYDVRRDGSAVTHGLYDHEGEFKPHLRHKMEKADFCNVGEFLNTDPTMIAEMNETPEVFEIGRTPIEPVWLTEDLIWKRPVPTRSGETR